MDAARLVGPARLEAPARSWRGATAILLACAVVTGFVRLGAAPVYVDNEAREGVYVRAMLATGDWILPHVPNHVENGETIPDKPPLFHWLSASAAWVRTALAARSFPSRRAVSRRVDEWTLRFPSAACGVIMVASLALVGRRLLGDRAALLAAASLLATFQFVKQARYGRVDMTMATWVTLSMLLLGVALLDGARRALLGAAAASALATLAKGPMGLALPGLAAACWIGLGIVARRARRVPALPWGAAALVWAALVLPWYLAAYTSGGAAFLRSQLLVENLHQYGGGNGTMRWAYYVGPWLLQSLPWNLAALLGVALAWTRRDRRASFCAMWWLVFLTFFQLSAYKRAAYLLPALPAGAMLCGYWLDAVLPSRTPDARAVGAALCPRTRWLVLALCGAGAALGALLVAAPPVASRLGVRLAAVDGALCGLGVAIVLLGAVLFVHSVRAQSRWGVLAAVWLCAVGLLHGIVGTGAIVLASRASPRPVVARVLAGLPDDAVLTVSGLGNDPSLPFLFYFPDPARIVVVPAGRSRGAPAAGYHLVGRRRWESVSRLAGESPGGWRVLWTDELAQRTGRAAVVFAERWVAP